MGHIALLGDSIFDNRSYTAGEPDVVEHLRLALPSEWQATLCAVDGTTTNDVGAQFAGIPADATHLVLSLGGNDALLNSDILSTPVPSTREALTLFATRVELFERHYANVLAKLAAFKHALTVCTIYNGNLPENDRRNARIALMMFNDVIIRVALAIGADILDLRAVCTEESDYANPIEPSGQGGAKIARAIAQAVGAAKADGAPALLRVD